MHKNIYAAYIVLVITGFSCTFASPSVFTPTPVDQTQATALVENNVAGSPLEMTPQPTQSGKILYSDNFASATSGWTRSNQDGRILSYAKGQYLTIAPISKRDLLVMGMSPLKFSDAVLSVDFQNVSGDSNNTSAVIAWRAQGWRDCYALLMSDNGFINVSRLENGKVTPVYDWAPEDALNTGHQVNHVDIVFNQETSTIYLNEAMIFSFTDSTYSIGEIGLGAISDPKSPIEVRFDNVLVYDPNEWITPIP
jgi:hypothetical protein